MTRAYVSLGSNIEPERNLRRALDALRARFGPLALSSVYRSRAVGFDGDDFLNLVAAFDSDEGPEAVAAALHAIEDAQGRDRQAPRFSSRTLDLDLLLYGDRVIERPGLRLPRAEIEEQAFVLLPLAELAPGLVHPVLGVTIGELQRRRGGAGQGIRRVAGVLPGG